METNNIMENKNAMENKNITQPPLDLKEMKNIMSWTRAENIAYTRAGRFYLRTVENFIDDIVESELEQHEDLDEIALREELDYTSPCKFCQLSHFHKNRDVCPFFSACSGPQRKADNKSVIFLLIRHMVFRENGQKVFGRL